MRRSSRETPHVAVLDLASKKLPTWPFLDIGRVWVMYNSPGRFFFVGECTLQSENSRFCSFHRRKKNRAIAQKAQKHPPKNIKHKKTKKTRNFFRAYARNSTSRVKKQFPFHPAWNETKKNPAGVARSRQSPSAIVTIHHDLPCHVTIW